MTDNKCINTDAFCTASFTSLFTLCKNTGYADVTHIIEMNISYRAIENDDLLSIQHVMLELGYSVEADDLKRNIEEILKRGGQIIMAEEDRAIVGTICVIIDVRLAEGIYAEIVSLVVSEKARGRGIGKGLVKRAEDWAKKRVRKIRVRANEVRRDAHLFYESQGYHQVKTQKIYIKKA